jgi:hypothetical protein
MSDEVPREGPVGEASDAGLGQPTSPGTDEPVEGTGAQIVDLQGSETEDVEGRAKVAARSVHEMAQQGDDVGSESSLGAEHRPRGAPEPARGDFTTTPSLLRLVPLGIAVGSRPRAFRSPSWIWT